MGKVENERANEREGILISLARQAMIAASYDVSCQDYCFYAQTERGESRLGKERKPERERETRRGNSNKQVYPAGRPSSERWK